MDYWLECIQASFEENGIQATDEQMKAVAEDVETSHEQYGMAHGYDAIPNPVRYRAQEELDQLKRKIKADEDWINSTVPCRACATTGTVLDGWGRPVDCWDCYGKGRVRR